MSKVSVFNHGWIDLVFEGRNQSYGAYRLRREDSRTTIAALIAGIALIGLLTGIPFVISSLKPTEASISPDMPIIPKVVDAEVFVIPVAPKTQSIEQPAGGTPAAAPTHRYTPLEASAAVAEPLPTTATVQATDAGPETTPGDLTGSITATSTAGSLPGTGTGTQAAGDGEGIVQLALVDVAPLYPGGLEQFYKDVLNRFNSPDLDTAKTLKVMVSFVVEKDGTLSNIRVLRDPGFGMGAEATRVLKSLKKKWEPGKKGNSAVRTAYNLPITINVL